MKKVFLFAMVAAAMASCVSQGEHDKVINQRDSIAAEKARSDAQAELYYNLITEVQSNFKQIKDVELGIISENSAEGINNDTKNQISEDFKLISDRLQQNQAKIDSLEASLAKSQSSLKGLRGAVASLKKQLKESKEALAELQLKLQEKDIKIASLDSVIAVQNARQDSMMNVSAQQMAAIQQQDLEMNKVWYLVASKKDLKAKGLKESKLRGADFNKSIFTEIDRRELTEIDLGAKKAELTTNHPESSYSLVKKSDSDKTLILKIKNQDAFWSSSKFLIVQTR